MKAVVIREFGPPEVMRLEEIPTPQPGPDEVLIRVHAVSVNRTLDLAVRAGTYAFVPALPHVLGVDPSGVVAAVGPGVTARKVGDRVVTRQLLRPATATEGPAILGVHAWGGYAEYVKVPASATHPIPSPLDFVTATVVARHAPTALSMLRDVAKLAAGEWVLVMGASGGLGIAGIQVAKSLGAHVIAAAGADEQSTRVWIDDWSLEQLEVALEAVPSIQRAHDLVPRLTSLAEAHEVKAARIYSRLGWIMGLTFGILALGGTLLYRKGAA